MESENSNSVENLESKLNEVNFETEQNNETQLENEFEKTVSTLWELVYNLVEQKKASDRQVKDLEVQYSKFAKNSEEYELKLNEFRNEISHLNEIVNDKELKIDSLNVKIVELSDKIEEIHGVEDKYYELLKELELTRQNLDEHQEMTIVVDEIAEEVNELKIANSKLEAENIRMRSELESISKESPDILHIQKEIARKNKDLHEKDDELLSMRESITMLESKLIELKHKAESVENLETEVMSLNDQLEAYKEKLSELNSAYSELRYEKEAVEEKLQNYLNEFERERENIRIAAESSLSHQNLELLNHNESLLSELKEAHERSELKSAELAGLQEINKAYESKINELSEKTKEIEQISSELSSREEMIATIQSELSRLEASALDTNEIIKVLKVQLEEKITLSEQLAIDNAKLQDELNALNLKSKSKEDLLKSYELELLGLKKEIENKEIELQRHGDDIERLTNSIELIESEKNKLAIELHEKQLHIGLLSNIQNENEDLKLSLEKLSSDYVKIKDEFSHQSIKLLASDKLISQLNADLDLNKSQLREMIELKSKLEELELSYNKLKSETLINLDNLDANQKSIYEEAKLDLAMTKNQLLIKDSTIENLRIELSKVISDKDKLKDDCELLSVELAKYRNDLDIVMAQKKVVRDRLLSQLDSVNRILNESKQ